jgi:hypothetical protein
MEKQPKATKTSMVDPASQRHLNQSYNHNHGEREVNRERGRRFLGKKSLINSSFKDSQRATEKKRPREKGDRERDS